MQNIGGRVGAWFADVFLYLIGYLADLFPIMVGYSGWLMFRGRTQDGDIDYSTLALRWLGFLLTVGAGCGLATAFQARLRRIARPRGHPRRSDGNDLMDPFSAWAGPCFCWRCSSPA